MTISTPQSLPPAAAGSPDIQPGDLIDGQYVTGITGTMGTLRAIVTHVGEWDGKRTISAVGIDDQGQVSHLSSTTLPALLVDRPGGDTHAEFLTRLRPLVTSARTAARLDALFNECPETIDGEHRPHAAEGAKHIYCQMCEAPISTEPEPEPIAPTNLPEAYRTTRYDDEVIGFNGFEVIIPEGEPARLIITPRGQIRGGSLGTTPAPASRLTTPATPEEFPESQRGRDFADDARNFDTGPTRVTLTNDAYGTTDFEVSPAELRAALLAIARAYPNPAA